MEQTDVALKIKGLDEKGVFTGYAAVYDVRDYQDDVIHPGAFAKAIAEQAAGYPLLWSHQQAEPIGLAKLQDSTSALVVTGSIDLEDPAGERAYGRVKKGLARGLSIGFTIPRGQDKVSFENGVRHIRELRLHEVSLVTIPAQKEARVVSVKSLGDVRHVLQELQTAEPDADTAAELLEIERSIKSLLSKHTPADKADPALIAELKKLAADAGSWRM
jgi:HK97 family phage prohead protease